MGIYPISLDQNIRQKRIPYFDVDEDQLPKERDSDPDIFDFDIKSLHVSTLLSISLTVPSERYLKFVPSLNILLNSIKSYHQQIHEQLSIFCF